MASWSSTTTPSLPTSPAVSDCPQCGSVCIGSLVLPCGHLTCRKCVRDHHGTQLTCHTCQHRLPLPKDQGSAEFTSLVQQLGTDPVMVQLVNQRLRDRGRQACLVCDNRDATNLCHDCQEQYCDSCAKVHRKQRATKDHVLQTLPQALHNVSSAACAVPRPRTDSASSTDSLESISNPLDPPSSRGQSRGAKRWKKWLQQQVPLLQAALSKQDTVVTALNNVMSAINNILTLAQAHQHLLHTLPRLDVTERNDVNTVDATLTDDDVSVQVKLDSMQQRLRDVIDQQQSASLESDVRQLIKQLEDLWPTRGTAGASSQSGRTRPVVILQPHTSNIQPAVTSTSPATTTSRSTSTTTVTPTNTTPTNTTATPTTATPTNTTATPTNTTATPTNTTVTPTVDPMTSRPRRAFTVTAACDDDRDKPWIISIISTQDGHKLVMVDNNNFKVKVVDMRHPHTVSASLTLNEEPYRLALLPDGVFALTADSCLIYLLTVTDTVTVTSRIKTGIEYWGVCGLSDGTLIASCERDDNKGVARVDVVRRSGDVVRTIIDNNTLTQLLEPDYLCLWDNHVFVSDCASDVVYKVDISNGQVVDTLNHPQMGSPRQVTVDRSGHVYIASPEGPCVLVRSAGGQWRELVNASQHSDQEYDWPWGVCVTSSGRLLVAWCSRSCPYNSVVIAYDL